VVDSLLTVARLFTWVPLAAGMGLYEYLIYTPEGAFRKAIRSH